jgi:hypothetical protein
VAARGAEPGGGARGDDPKDGDADRPVGPGGTLEIGLEHMRMRHAGWMAVCLVLGAVFVWKLGTVGQGIGVVLIAIGGLAGYAFARTLMFPAGAVVVADDRIELPRGLCRGEPARFSLAEVQHAYLLRRSVPWTRAAPVLVIEAAERAFSYPRDWFVTEADQRKIVRELDARGAGRASRPDQAPAAEAPAAAAADS